MVKRTDRERQRGAAMVEAICVISVFILFFLGMVYFYSLYHEQMRVQQLARAGAVAYAMDACQDSDALKTLRPDLGKAKGQQSTSADPAATVAVAQPNPPIGNNSGSPVGSSMKNSGFMGFQIADIAVNGTAAGTTNHGQLNPGFGFRSDVISNSYVGCGDPQKDGDLAGAFSYIKDSFPIHF